MRLLDDHRLDHRLDRVAVTTSTTLPLHNVRHSYVTAALEAGVPLKVVSDRAGHSSVAVTGDLYSHVRPVVDQAAADKIAALILGTA